jgi:hypothetical protein
MDLKDFVKESLVQIASGVKESQEIVRDMGGYVNPAIRILPKSDSHFTHLQDGRNVFLVSFEVALTVSESTDASVGAKLKVASIVDIGGGTEGKAGSTSTSRITFDVPLALPADEKTLNELKERDEKRRKPMGEANKSIPSKFRRSTL